MKTTILATLGLLNSAVQASWVVAGYTGQQCTGQELYRHSNPGTIDLWCAGLEYSTATSSVIINVDDDSDRSFEFELHHDGVCQDLNFGHFEREYIPETDLL